MSLPRLAESWVLGVGSSNRMKASEAPDSRGSTASFLWVSEGHHPNPGRAFLLSFLGEGAPGLSGDCPTWTREEEVG